MAGKQDLGRTEKGNGEFPWEKLRTSGVLLFIISLRSRRGLLEIGFLLKRSLGLK